MKFRGTLLWTVNGAVVVVLVITFLLVRSWTRARVEHTFADELRGNVATLRVLAGLQSEQIMRGCLVIAESPRLRAAAELQDPGTAQQLSFELQQTSLADLLVLTDRAGAPIARILDGQPASIDCAHRAVIRDACSGTPGTDVWVIDGTPYKVATAPLRVGTDVLGTLTLGFRMHASDIEVLHAATGSGVVLARDTHAMLGGLPDLSNAGVAEVLRALQTPGSDGAAASSAAGDGRDASRHDGGTIAADADGDRPHGVRAQPAVRTVTLGGETYIGTSLRTNRPAESADERIAYVVVKPLGQELARTMQPVYGAFGVVAVVFVVITSLLALVTRRNSELDDALQRLRDAQDELVRSERLAATGRLTAQLAHEINNPVHNIRSCLQTALTRLPADAKGRDLIDVAHDEIVRMASLTRQMLDVYRGTVVEMETAPVDVNAVVQDVLASSASELGAAGIRVQAAYADALPQVEGARDKLVQVFLNLVLNARDAMPSGGSLDIATSAEPGGVRIIVSDTGTGIDPANLDRVFDAFYTTKSSVSGVGLGLAVSYGIIRRHNGTITVWSEPGRGTRFTVTLPARAREAAPRRWRPLPAQAGKVQS